MLLLRKTHFYKRNHMLKKKGASAVGVSASENFLVTIRTFGWRKELNLVAWMG